MGYSVAWAIVRGKEAAACRADLAATIIRRGVSYGAHDALMVGAELEDG
jgi:hypothetical protein